MVVYQLLWRNDFVGCCGVGDGVVLAYNKLLYILDYRYMCYSFMAKALEA